MSEAQEAKARQYLAEGRLRVDYYWRGRAQFILDGSAGSYVTRFDGIWRCTCPARTSECVHVIACKLVCPLRAPAPEFAPHDPDLDKLFRG